MKHLCQMFSSVWQCNWGTCIVSILHHAQEARIHTGFTIIIQSLPQQIITTNISEFHMLILRVLLMHLCLAIRNSWCWFIPPNDCSLTIKVTWRATTVQGHLRDGFRTLHRQLQLFQQKIEYSARATCWKTNIFVAYSTQELIFSGCSFTLAYLLPL